MTTIEVAEAKLRLEELVAKTAAGEEFVLVQKGQPVARLESACRRKRIPNLHAGLIETSPDFDAPLTEEFEEVQP